MDRQGPSRVACRESRILAGLDWWAIGNADGTFEIGVIRFEKRGGKPNGGGALALQRTQR
jgi:hypothetical protein